MAYLQRSTHRLLRNIICVSRPFVMTNRNTADVLVKCPYRSMSFSWPKIFKRDINRLFLKDNVSHDCQLIYSNNNRWYLVSAYIALTPTVFGGVFAFLTHVDDFVDQHPWQSLEHPAVAAFVMTIFSMSLWLGTVTLMRRCFMRLYYHERTQQFIGMRFNWYMGLQRFTFTVNDVAGVRTKSKLFTELSGNIRVNERRFYISRKDFTSPKYYNLLMNKANSNMY